jgi:hypothetical protein
MSHNPEHNNYNRRLANKVTPIFRGACEWHVKTSARFSMSAGRIAPPLPADLPRGHRRFVEPQVNGQLSARVREVAEHSIRNHDMARILAGEVAAHHEFQGC